MALRHFWGKFGKESPDAKHLWWLHPRERNEEGRGGEQLRAKTVFLPNFQEINLSLKSLKFKAKALRQIKSSTEKEKKGERLR